MTSFDATLLTLMAGFAVKHFIADFALQTSWMLAEKARYGQLGGLAHAALHGGLSFALLLAVGVNGATAAVLLGIEVLLHYHIDYAKAAVSGRFGDTPADTRYWILFGFDQLLHHLTYVGLIFAALRHLF